MIGLRTRKVQPRFSPLDPAFKPVDSAGDGSIIGLKRAKTLLNLTHILAEGIYRGPDVAEVFKDEIFRFGCHDKNVSLRKARVKRVSFE